MNAIVELLQTCRDGINLRCSWGGARLSSCRRTGLGCGRLCGRWLGCGWSGSSGCGSWRIASGLLLRTAQHRTGMGIGLLLLQLSRALLLQLLALPLTIQYFFF